MCVAGKGHWEEAVPAVEGQTDKGVTPASMKHRPVEGEFKNHSRSVSVSLRVYPFLSPMKILSKKKSGSTGMEWNWFLSVDIEKLVGSNYEAPGMLGAPIKRSEKKLYLWGQQG